MAHNDNGVDNSQKRGLYFFSSSANNDSEKERGTRKPSRTSPATSPANEDKNDDSLPPAGKEEEELTKTQKLMIKIKEAGIAGIISYGVWEVVFWSASVPIVVVSYLTLTGHWPDVTNSEDIAAISAQAFVYVNFSRFAVPLRIGLALSTTPYIQKHIVNRFLHPKHHK